MFKDAASTKNQFIIKDDWDTLQTFSGNYKDLSAKIFSVRTSGTALLEINEKSQLVFETDGDIIGDIQLFKENASECVFLKQGENSVTLDNFKSITDAGYVIIAVISNSSLVAPYKDETQGTLTIRVENKDATLTPVITEIVDQNSFVYRNTTHHFSMPQKLARIRGKNFNQNCKILINNTELINHDIYNKVYDFDSDSIAWFVTPDEPIGDISVQVVTDTEESNVSNYYCGLPLSYLSTADSVKISWKFYVHDGAGYSKELSTNESETALIILPTNFTWSSNTLTVDLNSIPNFSGSAQYTFSNYGCTVETVLLNYKRSNEYPMEDLHFVGEKFSMSEYGGKIGYGFVYSNQYNPDLLNRHTLSIYGTVGSDEDREFNALRTVKPDQHLRMSLYFSQ